MPTRNRGFSLVELIIALLVGSILVSIAAPGVSGARARYAVTGARNAFSALNARARAQAIERGTSVRLIVDVSRDRVYLWSNGSVIERVEFGDELNVDIESSASWLVLCMTPRGYADTDCNNFTAAPKVTFRQNADTASLTMLPLGQLVY
jgi:prepilin-type N-terminal cleavage/methylation domain-containing protein